MIGPVSLPGREGAYELDVAGGLVAAIRRVDAPAEQLALPAFADLHVHADRAFARASRPARSLADAIELVVEIKRTSTEEVFHERAVRLFRRGLGHGSLRIRTHVDVDELSGERALRGVAAARDDVAGRVDVELVAFATKYTDPATTAGERRVERALAAGADLLGAVPRLHSDPAASLERVLDLARAADVGVDFHLDETVEASGFQLEHLADAVLARGMEGRVTASHCCALASVDPATAARTVAKVAAAGITVIALPALNLFLEDRGEATPRLRGLTLVSELVAAGVPVRFGSDNVGDVFYPYGDADPLEAAWLAALGAHVDDEDVLLAGICGGRTRVEPGDPADLVLVAAESLRDALARRPAGRTVLRAGEVVRG
ncbi:MAG: amidohydrolase family protein [Gaiella sp.]|nr:amidohydrolase family protein [Gaiella sp.]